MSTAAHSQDPVKKPNVSGQFYPSSPQELSSQIDLFLNKASVEPSSSRVEIIISPHAGYVYSGPVAAYGYKAASKGNYTTIVVIAPTHHIDFVGASVWAKGSFETPLGSLAIDEDFSAKLIAQNKQLSFVPEAFASEHSLEVQLPFLQKTFKGFKIVPIIMGAPDFKVCLDLAKTLKEVIADRQDVLIVISTDMSHYHSARQAKGMDQKAIDLIKSLDAQELWQSCLTKRIELCGFIPVTTALLYAKEKGLKVTILNYADSGDVSGDKQAVVGYFSAIFSQEEGVDKKEVKKKKDQTIPLTADQKKRLLAIARQTIYAYVKTGKTMDVQEKDPRLLKEEGAFVTLHRQGQLRGCIGNILGSGPLFLTVRDMAIASATQDPRFRPVGLDELDQLELEISVLSKPWRIKDPNDIELGVHGVIVSKGPFNRGLFLPQVATEQGWSREQFLSYLCSEKAGLPADAWKDPSVIIEIFTAQVFSEQDFSSLSK
jgi:AmmeMemoRadiSam system protein B/AmmeMemoRadiSam system protein A